MGMEDAEDRASHVRTLRRTCSVSGNCNWDGQGLFGCRQNLGWVGHWAYEQDRGGIHQPRHPLSNRYC